MISLFTLAVSVTTAPWRSAGAISCSVGRTAMIGVAMTTSSASATAAVADASTRSTAPILRACSAWPRSLSIPTMVSSGLRCFSASPRDVPISPSPMIAIVGMWSSL